MNIIYLFMVSSFFIQQEKNNANLNWHKGEYIISLMHNISYADLGLLWREHLWYWCLSAKL